MLVVSVSVSVAVAVAVTELPRCATLQLLRSVRGNDELSNAHFMAANISTSIDTLLSGIPEGVRLARVSLLHPDPWFKKRHHKRRFVWLRTQEVASRLPC